MKRGFVAVQDRELVCSRPVARDRRSLRNLQRAVPIHCLGNRIICSSRVPCFHDRRYRGWLYIGNPGPRYQRLLFPHYVRTVMARGQRHISVRYVIFCVRTAVPAVRQDGINIHHLPQRRGKVQPHLLRCYWRRISARAGRGQGVKRYLFCLVRSQRDRECLDQGSVRVICVH